MAIVARLAHRWLAQFCRLRYIGRDEFVRLFGRLDHPIPHPALCVAFAVAAHGAWLIHFSAAPFPLDLDSI